MDDLAHLSAAVYIEASILFLLVLNKYILVVLPNARLLKASAREALYTLCKRCILSFTPVLHEMLLIELRHNKHALTPLTLDYLFQVVRSVDARDSKNDKCPEFDNNHQLRDAKQRMNFKVAGCEQ